MPKWASGGNVMMNGGFKFHMKACHLHCYVNVSLPSAPTCQDREGLPHPCCERTLTCGPGMFKCVKESLCIYLRGLLTSMCDSEALEDAVVYVGVSLWARVRVCVYLHIHSRTISPSLLSLPGLNMTVLFRLDRHSHYNKPGLYWGQIDFRAGPRLLAAAPQNWSWFSKSNNHVKMLYSFQIKSESYAVRAFSLTSLTKPERE